jgi:hypothetical protein
VGIGAFSIQESADAMAGLAVITHNPVRPTKTKVKTKALFILLIELII